MTVTVFTKRHCVQCDGTRRALDKAGVRYRAVNVEENPVALSRVKALGFAAAPVVLVNEGTPDQEVWSGYRPDLISKHITAPVARVA